MSLISDAPRIMLVEHNRRVEAHLVRLLTQQGYAVVSVATGREALELLQDTATPPELLILSLESSRLYGVNFRREQLCDARLRSIPVIITSLEPLDSHTAADLQLGFYLRKPIQRDQLLLMVDSYCPQRYRETGR